MYLKDHLLIKRYNENLRKSLTYWFLLLLTACGASGVTGGGSSGGDDSAATTNPLYTGGPVDIPITIAKLEAPNPRNIQVTISDHQLTLTGLAGAIPNPTSTPLVWALDNDSGTIVTTAANADGSFSTITFTDVNGSATPSLSAIAKGLRKSDTDPLEDHFAVAGFNGTELGTPIFLDVIGNVYTWNLTNGSTIGTALTMANDTAYLVAQTTTTSSTLKKGVKNASTTSYCLYSLVIKGVPEKIACLETAIDSVFAEDDQVIIASGNNFYEAVGGEFTLLYTIDSSETIESTRFHSETILSTHDEGSEGNWLAVATDAALYLKPGTSASFSVIDSLNPGEQYLYYDFITTPASMDNVIAVSVNVGDANGTPTEMLYIDGGGNILSQSALSARASNEHLFRQYEEDPANDVAVLDLLLDDFLDTTLARLVFAEGDFSVNFEAFAPATDLTELGESGTPGSDRFELFSVYSSYSGLTYLLNGTLSYTTSGSGDDTTYTLVNVTKTREIYNAEVHGSGRVVFFCAEDDEGLGQMYAFCPTDNMDDNTGVVLWDYNNPPTEDQSVQLTSGEAHCTRTQNWKVDRALDSGSVVIVDTKDPTKPQIGFIDPYDSLSQCFE